MKPIEGRVAVVTGAASGIGRGMARAFAEAGMKVLVADIDAAGADVVAAELRASGAAAIACRADVTSSDDLSALADAALAEFGAVHVLANNAGVMPVGPLATASEADWAWTLGVNLRAIAEAVRLFLPHLAANAPAHIVNTGSMAGLAPRLGSELGVYSVSKAAVVAYSEMLSAELEPAGIGVSVLCPGPVRTRIWESERSRPAALGGGEGPTPPPRAFDGLDPLDVGRIVVAGVLSNDLYIFTNTGSRERIEHRFASIREGLDAFDRR